MDEELRKQQVTGEAGELHPDIKRMILASPIDDNSALMATGLTMREYEFAVSSGAYRQVYRADRKEFGYQLTAKGKRLRTLLLEKKDA
jgi:hypothetical protein